MRAPIRTFSIILRKFVGAASCSEILLDMNVGDGVMVASVEPTTRVKVCDKLRLAMRPSKLHVFDVKT
jgi:hypothetical protein